MADLSNASSDNLLAGLLDVAGTAAAASTTDDISNISAIQQFAADLPDGSLPNDQFEGAAISIDTVEAAALSGLGRIEVDADATITANSVAKSTAEASNVSDDSGSLAFVQSNSGLNGATAIDVASNAGLSGTATTTVKAVAATSDGDAAAMASLQASSGITGVSDLKVGGELTALGKAVNTITAAATTVVGDAEGAQATAELFGTQLGFDAAEINVSSDASIQGLSSLVNSATAAATSNGDALAEALAGNLNGATINGIDVGGVANVTGQSTFGNTSKATNVEGDSKAVSHLTSSQGLVSLNNLADIGPSANPTSEFEVSSDATLKGLTSVTANALAETTAGDAEAVAKATTINGADFQGNLDIGGIGSLTGAAAFNLSADASSVSLGNGNGAEAFAGQSLTSFGLKGIDGNAAVGNTSGFGINVASDATLSGTSIGSLKAEASSTEDDATAKAGDNANLDGAIIGDMQVGGIANLTGAAQLTSTAIAENVGGDELDALAKSGLAATVTGLNADFMDVASDATINAQAFGTVNATASSTGGDATATAGDALTQLVGLDALGTELNLDIGGVGTLSALAQGSETATATSVDGIATATAGMDLKGAMDLDFSSMSDGSLTGMAKLSATADASNIGADGVDAVANGDFSAIGLSSLDIGTISGVERAISSSPGIGGITTLKGQAQITGTLNAESVSGDAFAGNNEEGSVIKGMYDVVLNGASDATILGTASGVFNTNAISTGGSASGFSEQSLRGISGLDLKLGGDGGINAIVNDTNFVSAHSVSGSATAVASVDAIGLEGGSMHISGNATIMASVGVDSKAEASTVG